MATLSVSTISRTGITDLVATAVAADAGLSDKWAGTGAEFLFVNNGGGVNCVITLVFNASAVVDGQTPANRTATVNAGKAGVIGPFPVGLYNDANGFMNVSYSQVATVKVLPIKFVST